MQKKQKHSRNGESIDWDDRRDKYVTAVNDLYQQIKAILAEPIRQKTVSVQQRSKQLTENYIGTYSVDDLILLLGNEQVRFSPRGRNTAGAEGRVDVVGERSEAMAILQPNAQWGFVQTRQPNLTVAPFNEATLAEVLRLTIQARSASE